jgi:hypothetical protein
MIYPDKISPTLKSRAQWVLWRNILRDGKLTKVPFQATGEAASSTGPATWTTFDEVSRVYGVGGKTYSGVGFVFSKEDELCGIDLDGCRCPGTGEIEPWAREWIVAFDSYAEVSPSETGVKIWIIGKKPEWCGAKVAVQAEKLGDKDPAVECYDWGRYFAVTGRRLKGMPSDPQPRQDILDRFAAAFWKKPEVSRPTANYDFDDERAIIERARKYIARMPDAVSGQNGHGRTFAVACALAKGFGLDRDKALALLGEWNIDHAQPQWSDRELAHKIDSALKAQGERNYLRLARPHDWDRIPLPEYKEPKSRKFKTATDAMAEYIARLERGDEALHSTGIDELDKAIGGGFGQDEIIAFTAPSNHCKSSFALHVVHYLSAHSIKCHVISSEMIGYLLGKRTLLTMVGGEIPERDFPKNVHKLKGAAACYAEHRENWFIDDEAGTLDEVLKSIDDAVALGAQFVALDYVQMIEYRTSNQFDRVSHVSRALRNKAKEHKIALLELCQMNQGIHKRDVFQPKVSDIEYGPQIFKDADVVLFGIWPWKADSTNPPNLYDFYQAKNRNRGVLKSRLQVNWDAARQTFYTEKPKNDFAGAFDDF